MNEPYYPMKKPHGCWKLSGCLLTIVSTLLIAFFVFLIFDSEDKMDENRAEYAAYAKEYEEAMDAYNADSANLHVHYQRIKAKIESAKNNNDSTMIAILQDSLAYYDEPQWQPRGAIGVNIGAAFLLVFILILLIPLGIGLLMLLYYRYKYRKWKNSPEHLNL